MKKQFFLLLVTGLIGLTAKAQEIYIEVGKVTSNFNYENSDGDELDLLKTTNNSIGFGMKGPLVRNGERVYMTLGVTLQKYGATGSDPGLGLGYTWDVNYLGVNTGLEFDAVELGDFQFFLKGLVSGEFFMQGTQTINNQQFNLKGEEQFDGLKVFIRGGGGFNYTVKKDITAFGYYLIGGNYLNIGEDKSSNEKLQITTHNITIGVLFRLQNFARYR